VLADYRRYLMPVRPFTLAFRFMHYGRYGAGAQDSRLYPMYLGYETLLRGYHYNSFNAYDGSSPDSAYYQLFGSKMLLANVELRFPLFQVLGLGGGWYGILPMDFYAFFDSGLAWYDSDFSSEKAWFLGGDRRPLSSAGVGLRMNLFGYFIMGVSYAHPFDHPRNRGVFQITFWPGF
jgi:outer membrane protein assembly factor BamA